MTSPHPLSAYMIHLPPIPYFGPKGKDGRDPSTYRTHRRALARLAKRAHKHHLHFPQHLTAIKWTTRPTPSPSED